MTINRILRLAFSTMLLASFSFLLACKGDAPAAAASQKKGGRPPAVVQLAPVEQGSFDVSIRVVGRLIAVSSAELFARADGPITAVHAGSGDRVRKGQLLATIDPADAQQRVAQVRAALRMAEATRSQRESLLAVARAQANRAESLFGQNLLSQSDLDNAQAELASAQSQLELARAQVEQARANLNASTLSLEQTRIVAPFDGFIGTRHLDRGAHATTNRPVFSIVDISTIRTTVAIPAANAVHVRIGQSAAVTADVLPGRTFQGTVSRVSSVFDPQTNTVEAEIEVPNPEGVLKPGMFGSVAIAYRTTPTALMVPQSAVLQNESEQWLFVAAKSAEGTTVRRVTVRTLQSADRALQKVAVEPLEGALAPGDPVVVLGHESLSDGARVMEGRQ
ncbi:MAG TPA: efflux RND transporter periplasmic adaptor subunit [Thermoanaerobaculia bacterium]